MLKSDFFIKKRLFLFCFTLILLSVFSCSDEGESVLKLFVNKMELTESEKANLKVIINSEEEKSIVFSTLNGGFGDNFEKELTVTTVEKIAETTFGCNGFVGSNVILVEFKSESTAIRTEILCK